MAILSLWHSVSLIKLYANILHLTNAIFKKSKNVKCKIGFEEQWCVLGHLCEILILHFTFHLGTIGGRPQKTDCKILHFYTPFYIPQNNRAAANTMLAIIYSRKNSDK